MSADHDHEHHDGCGCEYDDIPLPEVDFRTFILSLYSSALMHLGDSPDPATGEHRVRKHLAKHTIDILAMLEQKTKGNLSEEENKALCEILCNLRMRYVAKNK